MIIQKAVSTPQESGKAFENINPQELNSTQQRSYLKQAITPSSGVSLSFNHEDVMRLSGAKLFEGIPPENLRAGLTGQIIIDPERIDSIATQARMFSNRKAIEASERNKLGILLLASDKSGQTLVEMRVDPTLFEKVVETSLLKPLEPEDIK
ncbi:MAG: hypothetical protein WCT22_05290 [Patescibacteria group bacterium]|jgi:hypothetical protein